MFRFRFSSLLAVLFPIATLNELLKRARRRLRDILTFDYLAAGPAGMNYEKLDETNF